MNMVRLLAGLALVLAPVTAVVPQSMPEPTATADARWPARLSEIPVHDPWIVVDRRTGTYNLFAKNDVALSGRPGIGTMMYSSRDLVHWTRPRLVFLLPPGAWPDDGGWAPEVHQWHGRWYLLVTMHNQSSPLPPGAAGQKAYRRGTILAVSDTLSGPFRLVRDGEPVAPRALMTLDGTLAVDSAGRPWMVYAHEWIQLGDGAIEAVPLDANLAAAGPPQTLFHGSDFPGKAPPPRPDGTMSRVTDGPELFRTRTGALIMLWSSFDDRGYAEGQARSVTGGILGPWKQLGTLLAGDSGHGMLFRDLRGRLLMIVLHPYKNAHANLYLMRDDGDHLSVVRPLPELDGRPR